MSLVLKDASNADVTFVPIATVPDGIVYERKSSALLGRTRVTLSLSENGKTNRVRGKLTMPSVTVLPATGDVPTVLYTEIGSFDFSVFRAGSEASRADLKALFTSLIGSQVVTDSVVDGVKPTP